MREYVYVLLKDGEWFDQTSIDEPDESLAWEIMVVDEGLDGSGFSLFLLEEEENETYSL